MDQAEEQRMAPLIEALRQDPSGGSDLPDPAELSIDAAGYWTKRAARRVLRGQGSRSAPARRSRELRAIVRDFPPDRALLGRDPCAPARIHLAIADALPAITCKAARHLL
jgi:hypothetical protein